MMNLEYGLLKIPCRIGQEYDNMGDVKIKKIKARLTKKASGRHIDINSIVIIAFGVKRAGGIIL